MTLGITSSSRGLAVLRRLGLALFLAASGPQAGMASEPAMAVLTVDAASGAVISDQGGGAPHHPASLTKMMTAYVAFRAIQSGTAKLDDTVRVSDHAAQQGGSLLGLRKGEVLSLGQALRAMIVRSANDAAVAVAEHLAGSEPAFAERMSAEARRLGMGSTNFRNATGMTAPGHITTPRDMAVLALAIDRDFPGYRALFSAREVSWKGHALPSVNGFLSNFAGAEGMKTGFTCPAGYNLVAIANRGSRRAVAVVMGAGSSVQRMSAVRDAMNRALTAVPAAGGGGRMLAGVPNLGGAPPDLSAEACGLRAVGQGRGLAQSRSVPAGWALEVAFGRDPGKVRRDLAAVHGQLRGRLGGGSPLVVIRPRSGALAYRGLIVGLAERKAIDICLVERARAGEERCLVLSPGMVAGALEDERRFRMIAAQ